MTDPTFGEIEFNIDAWDGLVSFAYGPSGTAEFAVHIWADESGPSAIQRATFDQLKVRYTMLWPAIAESLFGCRDGLSSMEELVNSLSPTVGCYIENEDNQVHANFELIYTFDLPGENGRGYFVRIVEWKIKETYVAE